MLIFENWTDARGADGAAQQGDHGSVRLHRFTRFDNSIVTSKATLIIFRRFLHPAIRWTRRKALLVSLTTAFQMVIGVT
ncbi:hypothetical protein SAMN05192544_103057 [Paraburkholderia hospita]|nr:hypothetical protein SAMN05192544_103057 [Paraburkholderia hospita]